MIHFALEFGDFSLFVLLEPIPLGCKGSDKKVTRFVGTAKAHGQLSALCIHNTARGVFLLATQSMIEGLIIAPSLTTTRNVTDFPRRFPSHTPTFHRAVSLGFPVFFVTLAKIAAVCGTFLSGLLVTPWRKRKPRRFKLTAIVDGAGRMASSLPFCRSPSMAVLAVKRV